MDDILLQNFIDNYTSADFGKIKFDWNGQQSDKCDDKNYKFRIELCEFLVPQLEMAKIELIKDLYLELARCGKETWGIYNKFHLFGKQLLMSGGVQYLKYYMQGASLSFDTFLASGQLKLTGNWLNNFWTISIIL